MKRILGTFWFLFFPMFAFAAQNSDSLSFTPPPSDFSVVFLGNIFGIVDGVLHGNGSQIMGTMFGVFNSAVLALGGIIIMYTLLVSTMNTAHEGQMLGQKWSSIWVPLRSTLGLALLIPKASGYCLMQIFVMWVAIQGVGAADKVWNAALSYLNRGGTIVQAQVNPIKDLINSKGNVPEGAASILSSQVCMYGLQQILEEQHANLMTLKNSNTGDCYKPTDDMKPFCDNPVPDFISSVNAISVQQAAPSPPPSDGTKNTDMILLPPSQFSISMPHFAEGDPYASLNGICGTLTWNNLWSKMNAVGDYTQSLSPQNYNASVMTRAMAVQQMYDDLATVAQIMVKNNPGLKYSGSFLPLQQPPYSPVAEQQFGIPTEADGKICQKMSDACNSWNPVIGGNVAQTAILFNGSEFQGAISDYNAIMSPTLAYIDEAKNKNQAKNQRQFIRKAEAQGWMMAGSYFFDLARISTSNEASANTTDDDAGLPGSFNIDNITTEVFPSSSTASNSSSSCDSTKTFFILCTWLGNQPGMMNSLANLLNGNGMQGGAILFNDLVPNKINQGANKPIDGQRSSTVYGFIRNSMIIQLPGQPGIVAPTFKTNFNLNNENGTFSFPPKQFGCRGFMCLASLFADVFYNLLFVIIWNMLMNLVSSLLNTILFAFILGPLEGMAQIFLSGVSYLQQTNANPIIALAVMGVNYINFAGNLWMFLLQLTIMAAAIPVVGFVLMAMLALVMPLLLAWLTVMVAIGFTTAYYIPVMPYMIFSFGVIAWLISVIEAMVAAPIVAVGVTHPEGHEAFGKGEHAIMILMNVFLRPAMMIIGYISAIALSYVAVWVINAGFENAVAFIQGSGDLDYFKNTSTSGAVDSALNPVQGYVGNFVSSFQHGSQAKHNISAAMGSTTGYSGWAGIYGFFFVILTYTTMYLTVVQKSFTLITYLPDKILRWIGGQAEGIGQETAQWGEETKGKIDKAQEGTARAKGQVDQQLTGHVSGAVNKIKPKEGSTGGID